MDFVIDRSKWRCGNNGDYTHGEGETCLLNAEGYMCCLGQIACQVGAKKKDILEIAEPDGVSKVLKVLSIKDKNYSGELVLVNTNLTLDAMDINDNSEIDNPTRERKLKTLFGKWKHKLTFKGKYRS